MTDDSYFEKIDIVWGHLSKVIDGASPAYYFNGLTNQYTRDIVWPNADLMMCDCLRRWSNIKWTSDQRHVFARYYFYYYNIIV